MARWRRLLPNRSSLGPSVDYAYLCLCFVVAAAAIHRFSLLDIDDPYKCKAVIHNGRWLDPGNQFDNKRSLEKWQPPGCLLHDYTAKDISSCLNSRRIVFVGDSTIRQIFWATAKKLDADEAGDELEKAEKHGDQNFLGAGVNLQFVWDPFLNSTRLEDELYAYRNPDDQFDSKEAKEAEGAALLLVGGGLWHVRNIEVAPLKHFRDSIDHIVSFMRPILGVSTPLSTWDRAFTYPGSKDLLLLAPVQVPFYESLSPARAVSVTPEKIIPMNEYLQQLSTYQGAEVLWSYALMTSQRRRAYEESGIHVVESVANRKADILLNLRCNAGRRMYPFDRTCCSNYSQPGWVQWLLLLLFLGVLPLVTLMTFKEHKRIQLLPSGKISRALLVLGMALCYCFYADRTQIFNKVQKQFALRDFKTLCAIAFGLGILSLRRSSPVPTLNGLAARHPPDQPLLSRDQTDEWKGWMQCLILIYHYTGASKILWVYEIVRLLVASYLFMTGFGHTVFFYQHRDYSLRRFVSVLIRLNLLACLLPYIMRTDYLFYYFAPLVTFWFVIIYFTMKVGHTRNTSFRFLLVKIILCAILVTALTVLPGILEAIFLFLKYTCRVTWDVKEWRFRSFLDMYIVYVGMLAGILFVKVSEMLRKESTNSRILKLILDHYHLVRLASVVVSLIVIPSFWVVTRRSPNKYDYNWWQPYISWLPVLSYVILRNSNRHFRNYYCSIFAWLGRCSLETFTLQFHIWLAGDTKGILSLGIFNHDDGFLNGGREDFVLFTAIFLWVSWHVAAVTGTITSWLIDPTDGRKEVEIEEPSTSSLRLGLIRTKSVEVLPLARQEVSLKERKMVKSVCGFSRLLRDDLRARLLLMLGVMWICNWTYT